MVIIQYVCMVQLNCNFISPRMDTHGNTIFHMLNAQVSRAPRGNAMSSGTAVSRGIVISHGMLHLMEIIISATWH